ncbi:MAG: SOS response-associated peptidase [Candidatus Heimdallarchaeota archaeon]|nr:SOS response-associated peptidase [Candidatus Heimdallarchaeota archaeon]
MLFQLDEFLDLVPQYNIAPGQDVYAVRGIIIRDEQQRTASPKDYTKEVAPLKWGLIPFWSKDPTIGNKLINSRSETVAEKPAFREAFKNRRCLIPTDGFYEWQKQKQGPKQPYFIHMKDNQPFAYGGIWEQWKNPEGEKISTFSILTTTPNEIVKPIHNRMPVIIDSKDFDIWLNPTIQEPVELKPLLEPYDDSKMDAYPISMYVNSPSNKGEQCIAKLEEKTRQQKLL